MTFLAFLFTTFLIFVCVTAVEVLATSVWNKSFILTAVEKLRMVKFALSKKKTAYEMLKEIQRKTEKYKDKYSVWDSKVSKFQNHYYWEIESVTSFLEKTNDEVVAEFNSTYEETVKTIYKMMYETNFIVSKQHHGTLLELINEIKADIQDLHEITNSIKVKENNEQVELEMKYVKLMREKRQMLKE